MLSERIRKLVKDPALRCDPRAEALLYAAARAQLVDELLEPLLAGGTWVLLDRFVDSSLAYQGAGRGLGIREIATLNAFATGGLRPTARCCCASIRRSGARASRVATTRPTGSSARRSRSSRRSPRRTTSSPPASPADPRARRDAPPDGCWHSPSQRWRT